MFAVVPLSVLLLGLLGMLVVAFAITRMTVLERRSRRRPASRPARGFVRSSV